LPRQRLRWVNRFHHFNNSERVESSASFEHHYAMPQSLAKILVHTVFSTKDRRPFLRDKPVREELHRYLGGILTNLDCQPLIIGGVEDHVHILSTLSRTCEAAEMVKEVKRGSSLWLKTKTPTCMISRGRMVTGFSPLDFHRSRRCGITLPGRRNITGRFRFKTSSGNS
jgi:REP element-mobilizing transposase RayT